MYNDIYLKAIETELYCNFENFCNNQNYCESCIFNDVNDCEERYNLYRVIQRMSIILEAKNNINKLDIAYIVSDEQ